MFQLINTNTGEKFNIENPRYVKRNENGIWVRCREEDAECISINGTRYSLYEKEPVEDAPNVLIVMEVDGGEPVQTALRENLQNAQTLEEVKAAVIDIYDALFDIYENGI